MSRWQMALLKYAQPYKKGISLILMLMISGILFDLLMPWPLKLILDYVITGEGLPGYASWLYYFPGIESAFSLIVILAFSTVVLFLLSKTVTIFKVYIKEGVGNRLMFDLGAQLFYRIQRLSLRFHGKQQSGDLVQRITKDSTCVRDLVIGMVLPLLSSILMLIGMFTVMWRLDRELTLLALIIVPCMGILIKFFTSRITERSYEEYSVEGKLLAQAEQILSGLPVVQAYGREGFEDKRYRLLSLQSIKAKLRTVISQIQFSLGVGTLIALGTAITMGFGGYRVLQGDMTVGSLLVFLSYLSSLYVPVESLANLATGYASAAAGARRIFEILSADEYVREHPGAQPLMSKTKSNGISVRAENVTFGYENDNPILQNVSFELLPGEKAALVGRTGAGKSTLISLLARFYDPWDGKITFDGVDIREVSLHSLRSNISIVLQDPFLLPITVAENISYGRPGAGEHEIVEAAHAAYAHEFIEKLPQGYQTVIGERGSTLSGGERQRLAIARAFLKDAPVLILDEPTSALDADTEAKILDAMRRLMRNRTTFIITHRMSMLQRVDKIFELENGKLVERERFDYAR
jgi:ATP-binding cassette, subfamily B, bacterial